MIKFDIITIFPNQISNFVKEGVFRIGIEKEKIEINTHDLRKWTTDKHRTVDEHPFGGGAGMVMKIEPIHKAIQELKKKSSKVILFSAGGQLLDQKLVRNFANDENTHFILICGHYEGVDHRVVEHLVDYEISIGQYVLSGGEIPALLFTDAITRLIPGVLGNDYSTVEESFEDDKLEYPQYTRPEVYNNWSVPKVLLTGNHKAIAEWRKNAQKKVN